MKLTIENLPVHELKPLCDFKCLEFGKNFSDYMLVMTYSLDKGWHEAKITPFADLSFSPATLVFHYAQEIFEGLKAYYREDKKIGLFRPQENFIRMNNSARRMCMPELDIDFVMDSLLELLRMDQRWVPPMAGASLYIRPTMIGIDPIIGLRPSDSYLFYIILSPVAAYYKSSGEGQKILVEDKFVRAVPGGVGDAKTGANYAASLLAGEEAKKRGFTQVVWLDGVHRKYVEEVGTSNIFFVYGDKILTPALNGSILPGITRKSVIELLQHWKMDVEETALDINQIVKDIKDGKVTECFSTGTAVVVSPINSLHYKNKDHDIKGRQTGPVTQKIYDELTGIQYGRKKDPFGWTVII
ncbi:MAG: branched-chain amino acid aminotransferase [Candidatus Margulisbacteria bacterium]|nr:branched-chain amino acid aminotransferase [Candidatus Margulisiibacteriota bacterium]